MSLTSMAQMLESAAQNAAWAQHKADFSELEARQEAAAYVAEMAAEMAEEKALGIDPEPVGEYGVTATAERVRYALENGGRAVVTVRSHKTGQHVTIVLIARKKKPGGQGWVSRATSAGRVGMTDADAIEARDPDLEYPDNYIGRFYMDSGEWKAGRTADGARVWTAERVLGYALGTRPSASEVFLAAQCSFCGKQLTDPESIERGIGPECYGKHTASKVVPHEVKS